MANPLCEVLLTTAELQSGPKGSGAAGAIVDFWGVVRRLEQMREIKGIEYEANLAMAEHQLQRIAERSLGEFELQSIVIHHRLGFVAVGEASVFVRVTSQNRSQAFLASRWIMDELKRQVPIWKRPRFKGVNPAESEMSHPAVISAS
ncbi:MAG: molybdopterin synthase catalytic subunit [Verrucomicrobiota bacterium]|jgi:molybdopterin synthase catalytic subunit